MPAPISPAALRRLQVLYAQAAAHSFDLGLTRDDRLAWASKACGRPVVSFSALTSLEGKDLIDCLQASLGIAETRPARRPRTYREREKAGTEGRHDQIHAETTMLAEDDVVLAKIADELTRLGWNQARLRAWLQSPSGPNKRRDTIRTLADANRVHWALKRMADRSQSETSHLHPRRRATA